MAMGIDIEPSSFESKLKKGMKTNSQLGGDFATFFYQDHSESDRQEALLEDSSQPSNSQTTNIILVER